MKNNKTEPIPVMDYRQYRRARKLVHECCNYIDGNCIALDDGEECVCVQSISYSLLCRWFRAAVLPQDKELETALFHRLNGRYQNVFLTDEELADLQASFPAVWEQYIEKLSEYMASTGKRYQSHAATIRRWAGEDAKKAAPPTRNRDYSVKEDETV